MYKPGLTMRKLSREKEVLERRILQGLETFQKATGMLVEEVNLEIMNSPGEGLIVGSVRVKIQTPSWMA